MIKRGSEATPHVVANVPLVVNPKSKEELPYEDLGRVLDILQEACVCLQKVYPDHASLATILNGFYYTDLREQQVRKLGKFEEIAILRGTLTESEKGSNTERTLRVQIVDFATKLAKLIGNTSTFQACEAVRDNPNQTETLSLAISRIRDRVSIPQGLTVTD